MDSVYKFSSTERIVLLEKELAEKLSELKTEVEEQGLFPGTGNRIFSSVQIPKDVAHFRREREAALKRTLQVAESKPLVIQADVLKRELESCLRREYTPENLPLLLLQYYTERITQLGQSKYLHVLRWKRLCQTSMAMEELYPLYKKQVDYIMQEFNDSVQRAERLSVARENFLMGKNNRPDLVTQEDLAIYTRWLVCHLHALRTIHHFLQALQYLPISRVLSLAAKQVSGSSEEDGKACVTDLHAASPGPLGPSVSGSGRTDAAFVLPQHVTDRDDLKPQLRRLLSHFHIPDDVQKLSDSTKEMGLFSSVSQNFQSIFMEQQRMWTFPDYEAGRGNVQNPTMSGPTTTLRKRADWIPFVKVKPKCDPWQKKMLTRLKERKRIDELMHLQSQFLKGRCTVIWCLDLLLAEDEGPKQDLSQKLCCFGQEGGWLSGAEDGAASEALWLSPVPETAGLCIPHPHPCSLPSAESRNQGGSRWSLRQKPLGLGGPLCSHQEGGRLSGAKDHVHTFNLRTQEAKADGSL